MAGRRVETEDPEEPPQYTAGSSLIAVWLHILQAPNKEAVETDLIARERDCHQQEEEEEEEVEEVVNMEKEEEEAIGGTRHRLWTPSST